MLTARGLQKQKNFQELATQRHRPTSCKQLSPRSPRVSSRSQPEQYEYFLGGVWSSFSFDVYSHQAAVCGMCECSMQGPSWRCMLPVRRSAAGHDYDLLMARMCCLGCQANDIDALSFAPSGPSLKAHQARQSPGSGSQASVQARVRVPWRMGGGHGAQGVARAHVILYTCSPVSMFACGAHQHISTSAHRHISTSTSTSTTTSQHQR